MPPCLAAQASTPYRRARAAVFCSSVLQLQLPIRRLSVCPSLRACRRKAAAAAGRKDAKLQYVVISEKWDK